METLKVLSLGAGVQSTTVLLMSLRGELPKLDAAIFANTQWEPQAVYEHLGWLMTESAAHGLTDGQIADVIRKHFKLTPRGIIETLNLRRPIYRESARHGHFGREMPNFTWEAVDKADVLRQAVGLAAVA